MPPLDIPRLRSAYYQAKELLLAERVDGHWVGELSSSALATATAVSALSIVAKAEGGGKILGTLVDNGVKYLVTHQNEDGGWGDTDKSYSNIATTYLVVAALNLAGRADEFREQIAHAEKYLDAKGRIAGLTARYGIDKTFVVPILTNCALAGIVPWKEVAALPFEAACVPQSWYRFMQLPVVSYAIPALVAIGQAKFFHDPPWNPITRVIRSLSVNRSLHVLRQMQPTSGGYLEAVPLTSFVVMSLASIKTQSSRHTPCAVPYEKAKSDGTRSVPITMKSGHLAPRDESSRSDSHNHSAKDIVGHSGDGHSDSANITRSVMATKDAIIHSGVKFLIDSARPDGSWPIDTNLATWVTTLALNALAGAGEDITQLASLDWLLSCQHNERHPFTGAAPGGFGWSDLGGAVPDADDTPGAMLAVGYMISMQPEILRDGERIGRQRLGECDNSIMAGLKWLRSLQNRDGGWPTFCRGWGKLPFDRSGVDLTAHVIRASTVPLFGENMASRIFQSDQILSIERGFAYIERNQRPDGSWVPLWFGNQDHPDEENPIYGTAKVLMAYRDCGRTETAPAQRGFDYLLQAQNSDGGWGGGDSVRRKGIKFGDVLVESTVEETALAVEALISDFKFQNSDLGNDTFSPSPISNQQSAIETALRVASRLTDSQSAISDHKSEIETALSRGLAWLCSAVENGRMLDPAPIGFYFAKLWYYEKLYPLVFTVSALGRVLKQFETHSDETTSR